MEESVLVTGASSGIGREIAKEVAADGYPVALNARRKDRLEELADQVEDEFDVEARIYPGDLTEEDAASTLKDELDSDGVTVHTLVNNAGYAVYGNFHENSREEELDMLDLNVHAFTDMAKQFVPEMVERGEGGVLNAGSIASHYPTPTMAAYGASKAYVLSFTRALAYEVEPHGVTVTAYCPGPVETEFMERGGVEDSNVGGGMTHTPEEVAEKAWRGYRKGKRIVHPSRSISFFAFLTRLLPEKTSTYLGGNGIEEGLSWKPF